jgi:hypothetical protein
VTKLPTKIFLTGGQTVMVEGTLDETATALASGGMQGFTRLRLRGENRHVYVKADHVAYLEEESEPGEGSP